MAAFEMNIRKLEGVTSNRLSVESRWDQRCGVIIEIDIDDGIEWYLRSTEARLLAKQLEAFADDADRENAGVAR